MAYRLALPEQHRFHNVFHVSLLKGYDSFGKHRAEIKPTPIVLTPEGELKYEVEKILQHRKVGHSKKLQFLNKCQGYDPSEATCEPESHLQNAPLKVQDYWNSVKATVNAVLHEQELDSDGELYYDCM